MSTAPSRTTTFQPRGKFSNNCRTRLLTRSMMTPRYTGERDRGSPEKSEAWQITRNSQLLASRGESVVKAYTGICNHVFETGNWPKEWTASIVIPLPKKGNLRKCNNYRIISLIRHPSKILLKVIVERLQPQAEAIVSEEQAGFRKVRSITEQIFNLRVMCEKFRQSGKPVYHNFVD